MHLVRALLAGSLLALLSSPGVASQSTSPLRRRIQGPIKATVASNYTFGFDGFNYSAPHIVGYTETTTLPQVCANAVPQTSARMWAYDAYLSDCATPWTVCMAQERQMTLEEALVQLARIPVGFRRFLSSVSIVQVQGTLKLQYGFNWWNNGTAMTCAGTCDQQTFIHVAAQIISEQFGYGTSSDWKRAVDSDSCVATKLATRNYKNAFAEAVVIATWKAFNGVFPAGRDWSCMPNQWAYLDSLPIFQDSLFGNSCEIQDGLKGVNTVAPPTLTDHTELAGGYTPMTPKYGATPSAGGLSLTAAPWSVSATPVVTQMPATTTTPNPPSILLASPSTAQATSSSATPGTSSSASSTAASSNAVSLSAASASKASSSRVSESAASDSAASYSAASANLMAISSVQKSEQDQEQSATTSTTAASSSASSGQPVLQTFALLSSGRSALTAWPSAARFVVLFSIWWLLRSW